MKMRKRLASSLLVLLVLLLFLTGCFPLAPTAKTTVGSITTPPVTTAPPATDRIEEELAALSALLDSFSPSRVLCAVRYTDPAVGQPLTAELALSVSGDAFTLDYEYDRLNPIGSAEMVSREVQSVSGAKSELSSALSGLYLYSVGAEGLLLLSLDLPRDAFSALSLEGGVFSASVRDSAIASVFGSELGGASGLSLSLSYSETAVSSLSLSYSLKGASVSATVTFS